MVTTSLAHNQVMTFRTLGILSFGLLASFGLCWHETGHRAVGLIAEERLSEKAKVKVAELLRNLPALETAEFSFRPPDVFNDRPFPGLSGRFIPMPSSLADAGPWPDEIRESWMDRPNWHYINLPIIRGNAQAKNPAETNVVNAIPRLAAWIRDETRPREGRAAAVAWLNHLIADVHMPLHAVALFDSAHPNGDRGGNDFFLDASGRPVTENRLHGFWDRLPGTRDAEEILQRISKFTKVETPKFDLKDLPKSAMDWALESKKVAEDWVYRVAGPDSDFLSTDQREWRQEYYGTRCRPIADQRIQLAGVRLAGVLNAIFEN